MPHEIPGVFHKLLRHGRGFGLSDLEKTAKVAGHMPVGRSWFRPEKVQATSSFACQLQSTYKDLSRVDLDLPEGLLVGLGYAATSPDSPFDFRQAQTAAERSGVAGPHCWSLMLPTSARVVQEVHEPSIGIQYPMLCSRMGDTWQIGTTSIREDQKIATGLRFVHWCHTSPKLQARQNPNNDPTVRVYQHLEDQLAKAGSDTEDILALRTTREGATNLRNYFSIAEKKANAETAVKVAGATALHCIVIHGVSTFLSGEGRHLDCDQECFTRANVTYSRATDLTILACPLNMQGMPGALQVLAALLHGVQTIYTYDSNEEPTVLGSLDLRVTQVAQATTFFQQALLPSNVARRSAGLSCRTPLRQGDVLGMVGDVVEELWIETASFASSSAISASVTAREVGESPSRIVCSSLPGSQSETERTSGVWFGPYTRSCTTVPPGRLDPSTRLVISALVKCLIVA